ncbi:MAG: hypothetical protein KAQ88_09875 [Hyphomicrobiaceae bacterium]|nr:hypothetical protein [Hyphomicrobiaceae bacterium]
MALDNTIVWIFTPDLGETHELADLAHSDHDNKTRKPVDERFDPADDTLAEIQRALVQYFPSLTAAQVLDIQSLERVAIDPAWNDKAVQILIGIHRTFAGANEANLPARARNRLRSLRSGNPNVGKPRP